MARRKVGAIIAMNRNMGVTNLGYNLKKKDRVNQQNMEPLNRDRWAGCHSIYTMKINPFSVPPSTLLLFPKHYLLLSL